MIRYAVMMVAVLFAVMQALAQDVKRLTINESAYWNGATHVVTVSHDELTETTDNTAQTLTVAVLAKQAVSMVAMVLEETFQDTATNANNTVTVMVGDGTDADLYLTSTELCVDGTEVFFKFGNTVWNSGSATNVTLAYGTKVYTADDTIDFKFTPHASYALSEQDTGRVSFYLRIQDAVNRLR